MKKYFFAAVALMLVLPLVSCYIAPPPGSPGAWPAHEGARVGSAAGALTGAILDHRNPWRGAVIGGALGAIIMGTVTDISQRAAMEAAQQGKTVWYRTEDGRGLYEAAPLRRAPRSGCTKVIDRVWVDGQLVRETERDVCAPPAPPRGNY